MNAKMVNTVATRTVALMSFQIVRRGSGMRSSISERTHLVVALQESFFWARQTETMAENLLDLTTEQSTPAAPKPKQGFCGRCCNSFKRWFLSEIDDRIPLPLLTIWNDINATVRVATVFTIFAFIYSLKHKVKEWKNKVKVLLIKIKLSKINCNL
jgi:hypothetical protein